jgi:LacI family transcriptional regulator
MACNFEKYISIHTDNFKGGYLAGKTLMQSGCDNPAVVMDERQVHTQLERLLGFKKALSEAHVVLRPQAIYKMSSVDCDTAYTAINEALNKGKLYDSYFCTTDWLAIGTMTALLEHSISIPEQSRIVGFDDISTANYCRVPLTTIHQDIKGMANLAVKIIIDILNGEEIKEQEFIFEPTLVRRQSG